MSIIPYSFTLVDGRRIDGQMLRSASSKEITLLLHGFLDNSGSFSNLIPLLPSETFGTLIALDLSGHGSSSHSSPDAYYTMASSALDVSEIIISLLSSSPGATSVHLIGHSMGTGVGLLVCSVLGAKISRFVMLDGLGPFTLVPGTDESSQLLRDVLERRLKSKGRGVGAAPGAKAFATVLEAAERRAQQNLAGKMTTEEAMFLAVRALAMDKSSGTYSWSSDPRLLWPSVMRYSESSVLEMCGSVEADVLIVLGRQGLFKQLLNLGLGSKLRLGLFAFSKLVGLLLWVASFFVKVKTSTAMRMGASMGKRVRAIRKKRVVLVEGGHHLHLAGEGAATVGKAIREWIGLEKSNTSTTSSSREKTL